MSGNDHSLKNTPLYSRHLEVGAKMVPFSGWNMPVQYEGIISEHIHTREKAGLFDICHMGEFFLSGPSAREDVDTLVTCRLDDMSAGRCRYGLLLNESGGIIDDLIVFKISQEEFMLVVNAGNIAKDKAWIEAHISSRAVFTDASEMTAKLDVQGPLSVEIMSSLIGREVIGGLKRFHFVSVDLEGETVLLSRTGYTGEQGYELFFPAASANRLWDRFLEFDDVKPIGLGARDTLRMEMGYSLYGSDIDEDHTPFESNLARFVFMEKDFIGRKALLRQKEEGPGRLLTGFICEGRRSARSHFAVSLGENAPLGTKDEIIGEVTSGAFSPSLKKGIGLCYIKKEYAASGRSILLSDGRTEITAVVKNVPIIK